MKYSLIISILITIQIFFDVSCVVNFKEYSSEEKTILTNTYNDLLGITVECNQKGALKNFAIKSSSDKIWFDYSCYSSLTESNEYDESILKGLYKSFIIIYKYRSSDLITSLGKVNILCPVDYALSKFVLSKDSNSYLVAEYSCVGVKSSYQTQTNTISSGGIQGSTSTLDSIIGITCGDKKIETDEVPGTPLRGFNYYFVESRTSVKSYCHYSYHKLRNIALEKNKWAKNTADLRNKNNQAN